MTATAASPCGPGVGLRDRLLDWAVGGCRDVLYAAAVMAWGVVDFTLLVTGVSVSASLLVLVVGGLVWLGFARLVRWSTQVDRALAGWQRGVHPDAATRRTSSPGVVAQVRTISTDPQTWRDLLWLALTSVLGFALGVAVLVAVGLAVMAVSLPAWYWAVPDPHAHLGITRLGPVTIDTAVEAFEAAGLGVVVTPVALLLARAGASAHARLAVRLLAAPVTPAAAPPGRNRA